MKKELKFQFWSSYDPLTHNGTLLDKGQLPPAERRIFPDTCSADSAEASSVSGSEWLSPARLTGRKPSEHS